MSEVEQTIITRFGKPVGAPVTSAGMKLKAPFIQDVNPIDKRILEGVADTRATETYSGAYNQSREAVSFYEFTRTMQSYVSVIADKTTLVLSTDSDLFKFLKGMAPDGKVVPARRFEASR